MRQPWVLLGLLAAVVSAARGHAGVQLPLEHSPSLKQVRLLWSGGGALDQVFRSARSQNVSAPSNALGKQDGANRLDQPPNGPVQYGQDDQPVGEKNVRNFGAAGDGLADDTAAINNALAGGGGLYLPPGTYRVSSALIITAPTLLRGSGCGVSTIRMTTPGPGNTIEITSDKVTVSDLTVEGPNPTDLYVARETAIAAVGSPGPIYLRGLNFERLEILNYGYHGIELHRVAESVVSANRLSRIGYAAVACLSCADVVVSKNFIRAIKPGACNPQACNAYGVFFSHNGKVPTVDEPASTHCVADGNTIQDIPAWEALDTHNGSFITFSDNVIGACRIGIHVGATNGAEVTMRNISIVGNTMTAGPAAHLHYGIVVSGYASRYASNVVVANNSVDGYGILGSRYSGGAIQLQWTDSVNVTGNVVENFAEAGIRFNVTNTNFRCQGNLISKGFSSRGRPWGIKVDSTNNWGVISGNRVQHGIDSTDPNVDVVRNLQP